MRMSKLIHVEQTERNQSLGMGGLMVQNGFFFNSSLPSVISAHFWQLTCMKKIQKINCLSFCFQ